MTVLYSCSSIILLQNLFKINLKILFVCKGHYKKKLLLFWLCRYVNRMIDMSSHRHLNAAAQHYVYSSTMWHQHSWECLLIDHLWLSIIDNLLSTFSNNEPSPPECFCRTLCLVPCDISIDGHVWWSAIFDYRFSIIYCRRFQTTFL